MIRFLRKLLINMLIYQLMKNGSLTKKEWKILHEQSLRLNNE